MNNLPIDDIISISVHAALAPIKQIFLMHNLDTDSVQEAAVQRAREKVREELSLHISYRLPIEDAARMVLKAFRSDRDRLTREQWRALEALEEALYGGEE